MGQATFMFAIWIWLDLMIQANPMHRYSEWFVYLLASVGDNIPNVTEYLVQLNVCVPVLIEYAHVCHKVVNVCP